MIIYGYRSVASAKGRGHFFCPHCTSQQGYTHKRVRLYFTLYFIPLIPLQVLGEYIECQRCMNTYREEVLRYDPEKAQRKLQSEYHRALKRVMVYLMMAGGRIDSRGVETVRDLYRQIANRDLSTAEVREEIREQVETFKFGITHVIQKLTPYLNDNGKEMILRAAFAVALADGEIHAEEKARLSDIGTALQMSPDHLRSVLIQIRKSHGWPR